MNMTDKNEWWEGNVFWKIIFHNLTPQTQQFIQNDVSKRLAEQRERIAEMVEGMRREDDVPNSCCSNGYSAALDAVIAKLNDATKD